MWAGNKNSCKISWSLQAWSSSLLVVFLVLVLTKVLHPRTPLSPGQTRMVGQPFSKCPRSIHTGCPKQCLPPPGKGPEQQQASRMHIPPQSPHPVPSCAAEQSTRLGPAEGPQQAGRQEPSRPFITQPSVGSPPPHTALFKSHSL